MSYKTDIIPLGELARQYCAAGLSKSQVVHFVTDCRLRSDGGYGHGNKAAKRGARLQEGRGEDFAGYSEWCDEQFRKHYPSYGVLHVTNTDRQSFSHVESDQQKLEQF